jgi:ATP-dependent Lhr-like helicase
MVVRSGGPRWSLASGVHSVGSGKVSESAAAEFAGIVLERWAVASRVSVAAEQPIGGFAGQYRVLSALAEAGACQRVYAVDGAGGAQFAVDGAVDSLREVAADLHRDRFAMSAVDPANPFGTVLSWPEATPGAARPARRTGALVVLDGADLRAYVEPSGSTLTTWAVAGDEDATALLRDLAAARDRLTTRRRALLSSIDGISLLEGMATSPDATVRWNVAVAAAGFTPSPRGWRWPTHA